MLSPTEILEEALAEAQINSWNILERKLDTLCITREKFKVTEQSTEYCQLSLILKQIKLQKFQPSRLFIRSKGSFKIDFPL